MISHHFFLLPLLESLEVIPGTTCIQVFHSWRRCAQLPMMRLRQNVHAGFQLPPIRQQNVEAALVAASGASGTWCCTS